MYVHSTLNIIFTRGVGILYTSGLRRVLPVSFDSEQSLTGTVGKHGDYCCCYYYSGRSLKDKASSSDAR